MPGYWPALWRRIGRAVGAGTVLAVSAGCSTGIRPGGYQLADALEQAEQRNLADVATSDHTLNPSSPDRAATPSPRPVTLEELATVTRLVRQTDDMLRQLDRVSLLGSADGVKRDRLVRSLAMQAIHTSVPPKTVGWAPVRTDVLRPSDRGLDLLDVLTLSEMADAPAEPETTPVGTSAVRTARGPLPGFGQTVWRDFKRIHLDLWDDTKRVYWNPTNAVILITAGGASLALRPEVDDDIEDYYRHHHTVSKGWRDTFGLLGNPGFHFAMAGAWYLAGQQLQHTKTYEVSKTLFSALIINGVSTSALKLAACTDSPNGEAFGWPSGHTSSAFTVAAVMHQAYGHWAGIPLYGVAGMVGLTRLDDREHHFSDVVFGAAMGLVIGHTVASGHRPQIFGGDLVPYADPTTGGGGLAWFKMTK